METLEVPQNKIKLTSQTSVTILQDRCRRWIKDKFGAEPWMPSIATRTERPADSKKPLHVVLMGDFFSILLRYEAWPKRPLHIWVLSSSVRRVLIDVCGFSPDSVGVIPRYEIFPIDKPMAPFPAKDSEWTMIFGGRLCSPKGIDLLVRVTSFLQNEFGQKVRLKCFGAFHTQGQINFEQEGCLEYEGQIQTLCKETLLKLPPEFHEPLPTKEWMGQAGKNSVFVSFSNYHMEDFGVAVAQAQAEGWPCILTDWGGHNEVEGENVLKLPVHMVGSWTEPPWIQDGRAYSIASEIVKFQSEKQKRSRSELKSALPPKVLESRTIEDCVRHLERTYSADIHRLYADQDFRFCCQDPAAIQFYRRFNRAFASSTIGATKTSLVLRPPTEVIETSHYLITPSQEMSWAAAQTPERAIQFVQLPNDKFENLWGKVDNIVDLHPSATSLQFMQQNEFKSTRRLLYLHELANKTFYPWNLSDLSLLVRPGDTLLGACTGDKKTVELLLENSEVSLVAFPIQQMLERPPFSSAPRYSVDLLAPEVTHLYYAGGVTEQSNLHTVFLALGLLSVLKPEKKIHLKIFESPSENGSPNMRLSFPDYKEFLRNLLANLKIGHLVSWHPPFPVHQIAEIQKHERRVFISASLHSDENLAPFAQIALHRGHPAVLTNWGGHRDLASSNPEGVLAVNVCEGPSGPYISPLKLAQAIDSISGKFDKWSLLQKNSFQLSSIVENYRKALANPGSSNTKFTAFGKRLRNHQAQLLVAALTDRGNRDFKRDRFVFESYSDSYAQPFFAAYGASAKKLKGTAPAENEILILPWVQVTETGIQINDPHRGQFFLERTNPDSVLDAVPFSQLGQEKAIFGDLTRQEADWLIDLGFGFEIDLKENSDLSVRKNLSIRKIRIQPNEQKKSNYAWKVTVDGHEYFAKSIFIKTKTRLTQEGIICDGKFHWDESRAEFFID